MLIAETIINPFISSSDGFISDDEYEADIEFPTECPHCGKPIFPSQLTSIEITDGIANDLASIFYCNLCNKFIFTLSQEDASHTYKIHTVYPYPATGKKFSDSIETISPSFTKIYKQAAQAESYGCDEICGMGYRKALEFLMRDYAIKNYPEKNEEISKCTLSQCINTYCDNDTIKKLAMASAWLGNDETHYVRKYENYSIVDLKAFIDVIISYIEQKVTINRAEELLANRKNKE